MMVLNVITGEQIGKIINLNFDQKTTESIVFRTAKLKGQRAKNKFINGFEKRQKIVNEIKQSFSLSGVLVQSMKKTPSFKREGI